MFTSQRITFEMSMLSHPFYKYSFFTLLIVDLIFTAGLVLSGVSSISLDTLLATSIWFVCFYWLPVWLAAYVIFALRIKGVTNTLIEWFIAVGCLSLGLLITDYLLQLAFGASSMGAFIFFGGLSWATPIYFISRYFESRAKISQEKQARKQAQLQTLRYQLNPHFMFNSLNTISAYIHSNPDLADEVLHELADILRYSLETGEAKSVSLQQEIDIIHKYLNIEKARFGDRLVVVFDIPKALLNTQVPPLILQPIVENAIKHNADQTHLSITVKVETSSLNGGQLLTISVSDNGCGFTDEVLTKGHGKGVGMRNLQQRVQQLPSGKVSLFNNANESLCGATVKVEMAL
ncbi:histidine kinase [Aliiglaciecola sp. LCG003]|uniref:sensor histidine kinase n=1 Tax=Aliiglaciecola sp. LCG003 TaxID=3053655 RepID=UPI002573AD32|nr:histidine kinase [Aliiglaciecola sp. LCG003]WJG10323.1 histidine kinase [Aliiglaciecola sp. LCG003]